MKKKIIGFVYAILITAIIVFEYINAVWPHTIPCINGRVAFVLIPLLATLWILLYNDKVKLRYVALIVVVNFVLVICPTIAIESFIMKKDKTIKSLDKLDLLPQETRDNLDLGIHKNVKYFIEQYAKEYS